MLIERLLTHILAVDCEMVGVGPDAQRSILARCSIVNYHGQVVYDKYVKPTEPVTDYRTSVSGVRAEHLLGATDFATVRAEVASIIEGRILVAHSMTADLQALMLDHPPHLIRDTAFHPTLCPVRPRSLKTLVKEILGVCIQEGEHDSVEDARAVLSIYKSVQKEWELSFSSSRYVLPAYSYPHQASLSRSTSMAASPCCLVWAQID